ncbi:MAG: hypothetical protein RBT75_11980 [Anaerolineae bacterium]|jgi:hypothetical protein|nr:hypothetical protein [Anaerolineae bacterium]
MDFVWPDRLCGGATSAARHCSCFTFTHVIPCCHGFLAYSHETSATIYNCFCAHSDANTYGYFNTRATA